MAAPALPPSLTQELFLPRRDVFAGGADGLSLEPIADPVLQLSQWGDWREYQAMDRDPCVRNGRQHVERELFGHGFEVRDGEAKTPASARLWRFGRMLWSWLPAGDRRTLMERSIDAPMWGWRPFQAVPTELRTFEGAKVWLSRLVDKPPHHFRFTRPAADGTRELVVAQQVGDTQPQRIGGEELELGWITPRAGTLASPYGAHAQYQAIWILWTALREVRERWMRSFDRSLGTLSIQPPAGADIQRDWTEIQTGIQRVLGYLNGNNVLLLLPEWKIDFLRSLPVTQDATAAMETLKMDIHLLLAGQRLTQDAAGDVGSYALGKVHRSVQTDYARDLALQGPEQTVTAWMRQQCRLNFGEVDPADCPFLVSRIRTQVTEEAVRVIYDLGGTVNLTRLAHEWNASDVLVDDPDDTEDVVSSPRPAPQPSFLPPSGGVPGAGSDDDEEEAEEGGERVQPGTPGARTALPHAVRSLLEDRRTELRREQDATLVEAGAGLAGPLARYVVARVEQEIAGTAGTPRASEAIPAALAAAAAASLTRSLRWSHRHGVRSWQTAVDQGLVSGPPETPIAEALRRMTGELPEGGLLPARAAGDLWARIGEYLLGWAAAALAADLAGRFLAWEAQLVARLQQALATAEAERWSEERRAERLAEIARRYGSEGLEQAPAAQRLLEEELAGPRWRQAEGEYGRSPSGRVVIPYRLYAARLVNTRENHAALHGFAYPSGWEGEGLVIPPHGWNCFCRILPVTLVEAEARGWQGNFPAGTSPLQRFLALGGSDSGFPRQRFVAA